MNNYSLSDIYIYPVKALPGIRLREWMVEERGFRFDRRWMLVDETNMFMTQRFFPQMVFIKVELKANEICFSNIKSDLKSLSIPLSEYPMDEVNVQIWDDECTAMVYGDEINDWFSKAINYRCKLVYMPESALRRTSTEYYAESKKVSFADGYPYLIIGQESLNYLNSKLKKPVSMEQFRPNLVFEGGKQHAEDSWNEIIVGNIKFAVIKPCARCVVTTINLETGKKEKEPLSTLNTYRNVGNKIMFGQNIIALDSGTIKTGDRIKILDK